VVYVHVLDDALSCSIFLSLWCRHISCLSFYFLVLDVGVNVEFVV
jgi:hypothetical protein